MARRVLITGAAGLVGSECCRLFAEEGFDVVAIDNFARGSFFPGADTSPILRELQQSYAIEHHPIDIRDEKIRKVRSHYPSWRVRTSLEEIFTELLADLSAVPVEGSLHL